MSTELKLLQEKAEKGDVESQLQLGKYYHYGLKVKKDLAQAIFWYKMAIAQGCGTAQFYLLLIESIS